MFDTPWMLGVSAVSIRCLRSRLHCYPRQSSFFSGFHDSLFLTLVKSDRRHPQGYWCSNGDDENDVLGSGQCGALNTDSGLGDSGRRVSLSGLSKKAVPFYENPPLRHHLLVRLGRVPPVKNLTEKRNSRRRNSKRTLAHATLSLLGDNDATVRPHSDNSLTNSQRSLWITAHHLSAVTSICPLVHSATL